MTSTPAEHCIVLIGPRGAGKSAIARRLAARLGWEIVSTDARVVDRIGRSIADYVAEHGWEAFRDVETHVIAALGGTERAISDTGGGAVLREENRRALTALGPVIYLTATPDVLAGRIGDGADRPSLTDGRSAADEIADVLRERAPLYRSVATLTVDTTPGSRTATTERILRELGLG